MKIESSSSARRSRGRDRVITFYSYKGGTGRTMAMANVAWILASQGKTVLTIDWDLEAPGLHRYFAPFLPDPGLQESSGLIDLLLRYMVAATKPSPESTPAADWYADFADLSLSAEPLVWKFPNKGRIDLLGAGKQGPSYAARVNRFDWNGFYETFGGAAFLDEAVRQALETYDYVLIDSRTGVSDTSGICTVQLPDSLVVFFTLNTQSIEGASGIAADVVNQRNAAPSKRGRPFRVFPVPTRIELAEKHKLEARRKLVAERFGRFLGHMDREERTKYLGAMEVLYDPYYAYEEILATVADQPGTQNSVLAAFELLAGYLTDGEVTQLARVSEARRDEARTRFEETANIGPGTGPLPTAGSAPPERVDVFLVANNDDEAGAAALALHKRLDPYCKVFEPSRSIAPGQSWRDELTRAAESAAVVVFFVSSAAEPSPMFQEVLALAGKRPSPAAIIPAPLDDGALESYLELKRYQGVALHGKDPARRLDRLERAVLENLGIQPEADTLDGVKIPHPLSGLPKSLVPPSSPIETAWDWIKNNAAVAATVFILATGWLYQSVFSSEDKNAKATRLTAASYELADRDPTLSLLLARAAAETEWNDATAPALRSALRASRVVRLYSPDPAIGGGTGAVRQIAWSPSGEMILSTGADRSPSVSFVTEPGRSTAIESDERSAVVSGAWARAAGSRGGDAVRIAFESGRLVEWSAMGPDIRGVGSVEGPLLEAAWSDNGQGLLARTQAALAVWRANAGKQTYSQPSYSSLLPRPWNPDGQNVALVADGRLVLVDSLTGESSDIIVKGSEPTAVAWHPSAPYLAAGLSSGTCVAFPLGSSSNRGGECPSHQDTINWAEWNRTGDALATASDDATVIVSRLRLERLVSKRGVPEAEASAFESLGFLPHTEAVLQASWAPRGTRLLTVAADGIARIWALRDTAGPVRLSPRDPAVPFTPEATRAPLPQPPLELRAKGADDAVLAVWSPDGGRIATGHRDGTVRVWSPDTESLDLDVDSASLLELARERSPRAFTPEERQQFDLGKAGG